MRTESCAALSVCSRRPLSEGESRRGPVGAGSIHESEMGAGPMGAGTAAEHHRQATEGAQWPSPLTVTSNSRASTSATTNDCAARSPTDGRPERRHHRRCVRLAWEILLGRPDIDLKRYEAYWWLYRVALRQAWALGRGRRRELPAGGLNGADEDGLEPISLRATSSTWSPIVSTARPCAVLGRLHWRERASCCSTATASATRRSRS